jgi:hypothetical protein
MNNLINSPIFWWCLLVLYVVLVILSSISALRKGKRRFIYSLKNTWNFLTYSLNLFVAMYFVIIAIIPIPLLKDWVNNNLLSKISVTSFDRVVYHSIPVVYSIFVVIIMCWIMIKGLIPRIKYNEQEKQWDRESEDKLRKWLHLKPKKDKSEDYTDK